MQAIDTIERDGPVLAVVQRVADRIIWFRDELSPPEQAAFDIILSLAARDHDEVMLHGHGHGLVLAGTPVARLAHLLGVSAVALSIALSTGVAPVSAAPGAASGSAATGAQPPPAY